MTKYTYRIVETAGSKLTDYFRKFYEPQYTKTRKEHRYPMDEKTEVKMPMSEQPEYKLPWSEKIEE